MSVAQIHQLDHHRRPFADVVPFGGSPLRVREMVPSIWVLVIMLWFAKFDASRVYQREKNPILEEAIQGATVRLCHLMENHWPTLFPYIRGMMIREIKKPMVSTVSDMKMKASRISDLMLEPDALQPFLPPPEEVRKAEKLAQLWHPGKHLPVQDTEDHDRLSASLPPLGGFSHLGALHFPPRRRRAPRCTTFRHRKRRRRHLERA